MKHTPGPWKWEREWEEDGFHSGGMGGLEPGVLWFGQDGEEDIYCRNPADARLIVAAPELLGYALRKASILLLLVL